MAQLASVSWRKSPDDPVSAAVQAAALAFAACPDAPSPEAEVLALWIADLILALRLRWARPMPLIATKILDPGLKSGGVGRRVRPGEPAWEQHAAGAIALASCGRSRRRKWSTCCSPRIASPRPRRLGKRR